MKRSDFPWAGAEVAREVHGALVFAFLTKASTEVFEKIPCAISVVQRDHVGLFSRVAPDELSIEEILDCVDSPRGSY